jgi:hypothetical protein
MRKQFTLIIFFLVSVNISFSQMPHWQMVSIPKDSIAPISLTFFDSLHGFLICVKQKQISLFPGDVIANDFYFETSDGGRSWNEVNDPVIIGKRDSALNWQSGGAPAFGLSIVYGSLSSIYFYTGNITGNHPPLLGNIVRSDNGGLSWFIPDKKPKKHLYPLHAFTPYDFLAYDADSGTLYESYDGGSNYRRIMDSTFYYTINRLQLDTNYTGYGTFENIASSLSFDNSDRLHWTVAINNVSPLFNLHPPVSPMGLQILQSDNLGTTWKSYLTPIPGEDSNGRIQGTLQFIKNTPNLYYFTSGTGSPDGLGRFYGSVDYGDPMLGINWLYSIDYGKSWEIQKAHGDKRRAHSAVRNNEVWITARPSKSLHSVDPAIIIARTTDNGKTWEADSSTLHLQNDGIYDGRIMTFSDPRHGWIAASIGSFYDPNSYKTAVFRYDENEQFHQLADHINDPNDIRKFMKIYPNPSQSEVNFNIFEYYEMQKVEFYDVVGRKEDIPFHADKKICTADVSKLSPGLYIIKVNYTYSGISSMMSFPFIVQR